MTQFIVLTDLWQDGRYLEVGEIINQEKWSARRVAQFCQYVYKYLGTNQLDVLYKFL